MGTDFCSEFSLEMYELSSGNKSLLLIDDRISLKCAFYMNTGLPVSFSNGVSNNLY